MKRTNVEMEMEQDTILGIAPILPNEKKYGFIDFLLIISGYAIATWCYTQGAYSASMMDFKQLILSTFGVSILILPIVSLPVIMSVRYGIDVWVWFKTLFGNNGSKILAVLAVAANFPWYAVASSIFGKSMGNLFAIAGLELDPAWYPALGCASILIGTIIALAGNNAIKWMTRIMVPAMLGVGIIVVIIAMTSVPMSDILAYEPAQATENPLDGYMIALEGVIAFAFSWTAAMFVLPRLCKKESSGYWATSISYGVIAPFFIFAGGVMAIALSVKTGGAVWEDDPTTILRQLASPAVALLSLILVGFANIGTQAVGSNMNALVLKSAFPKVKYSTMVIILGIYVGALTIWDKVVAYFGSFLAIETYLYAPMMAILFVDFFFLKKQKIDLREAYGLNGEKNGKYRFTRGFNIVSFVCVGIAIVCGCLVFNPITGTIYSKLFYVLTGSGVTFIVGGVLYFVAAQIPALRKYMVID